MTGRNLTDSECLVLGLVAEMPRHGYELERVIEQRGMREWTQIAFSSIYFVLGKLEDAGYVKASRTANARAKKSFSITRAGRVALIRQTKKALTTIRPSQSSLLQAMLHWPVLNKDHALEGLRTRRDAAETELQRLQKIRLEQQPLPDYADRLFEFVIGQLRAESTWIEETLEYMESKPWLE